VTKHFGFFGPAKIKDAGCHASLFCSFFQKSGVSSFLKSGRADSLLLQRIQTMILPIVAYGSPVLKEKAADINPLTAELKALVSDMYETMYNADGCGLAAPQIGKSIRLFVIDAELLDEEKYKGCKMAFVNAQMLEEPGEIWACDEGCLSIPGIREEVKRPGRILIRYQDEDGTEHTREFEGMMARVIQHEYDHIEGRLFIDHLSPLKKRLIQGKLNDILKGKAKHAYPMRFAQSGRR
jgi:peptide deformylase